MRGVTPPPVEAGDEVAMLAPSSRMPDSIVERGVERLRASFDVYPSAVADDRLPPDERAEEIQEAFESDATAVFAVTGGEDQLRLLPHLDLERLQDNPTRFFGISDNTHLHLALSAAGVVSYYGCQFVPGIALDPTLPEYTERYLCRTLFEPALGEVEPAAEWTDDHYDFSSDTPRDWESNPGWAWEFPASEPVTGPVWGGCVVVLEQFLAADRCVPEPEEEFVLALETSELLPEPYTVTSVLRCLGERNLLEKAAPSSSVGRRRDTKRLGPNRSGASTRNDSVRQSVRSAGHTAPTFRSCSVSISAIRTHSSRSRSVGRPHSIRQANQSCSKRNPESRSFSRRNHHVSRPHFRRNASTGV
jgi:muramoyltetrapeptide carboxypeptidase LdcA involved in peptidoglycan recycling